MGARLVDFGGYEMPVNYGSQIEEHHAVRTGCGVFDVSHMGVVDVTGPETEAFLLYLLANDIRRLNRVGAGQYSLMLNEQGGVIDDLILYKRRSNSYRLVVNCANKHTDIDWMKRHAANYEVQITERSDIGILALQGPNSAEVLAQMQEPAWAEASQLKRFQMTSLAHSCVARTGYTGEDGFEILCANDHIEKLWADLLEIGAVAAGLGARDTLRLEAGYCLWGHEMDETISPLVANLSWTIQMQADRDFIGRNALQNEVDKGIAEQLVGLVLQDKGVIRDGCQVQTSDGLGVVTSGSYSPSLEKSIALARLPVGIALGAEVEVVVRNRRLKAQVTKPAFVSNGKALID